MFGPFMELTLKADPQSKSSASSEFVIPMEAKDHEWSHVLLKQYESHLGKLRASHRGFSPPLITQSIIQEKIMPGQFEFSRDVKNLSQEQYETSYEHQLDDLQIKFLH